MLIPKTSLRSLGAILLSSNKEGFDKGLQEKCIDNIFDYDL